MIGRIADLTWRRPKLVLALVAAFMAIAGAVGHDVEKHLKAAGFTDSASESERATALLRAALGYDPNPGIVVLVRSRDAGRLNLRDPSVHRGIRRLARELAKAKYVGHVISPLDSGPQARALTARDERSVVITGHLSVQDVEDKGGAAADDVKRRLFSRKLDVAVGGFAASFSEVNDQTRKDLTKAELIAFPILAVLL